MKKRNYFGIIMLTIWGILMVGVVVNGIMQANTAKSILLACAVYTICMAGAYIGFKKGNNL